MEIHENARRLMYAVVGVALLAAACAALVFRYVPIPGHLALYGVIMSPYLLLAAPVAVVLLLSGRRWVLAGLACALTVSIITIQLPWYVGLLPRPASVHVRVMTLNMRYGNADPVAFSHFAAANADVIMVQEFTPAAARGLKGAGIDDEFPHHAIDPRSEAAGIGVYSRYPIIDFTAIDDKQPSMVTTRIRPDGSAHDTTVVSLHLSAPWPQPIADWNHDIARLPGILAELATTAGVGSIIVGGDFNSTIDMRPFRRLLTNGYRDAAEQAGSGRNLTYPSNRRFPPIIGIDHVLTRNATAVSTSTVELPGTDHRALLATVMVPAE